MRLQDWFNVHNSQHIEIFKRYRTSGVWKLPSDVIVDEFSVKDITYALASAWLRTFEETKMTPEYDNNWARAVVMVNVNTGQVEMVSGDRLNATLKSASQGFDVLNACLIPEPIREELVKNIGVTDGPYLVSLKEDEIYLERKYNCDYKGVQTCTCGHEYYRHFDTYEEMSAVGCKYCHCGCFTPAADDRECDELIKDDTWLLPVLERAITEDNLWDIENADLRELMKYGHKMWGEGKTAKGGFYTEPLIHEWQMMRELHGIPQTAKLIAETLRMGIPKDGDDV